MPSRDDILASVRKNLPPAVDLPSLDAEWIDYADLRTTFVETVNGVGGTVVVAPDLETADRHLRELEPYRDAATRCALVPGVGESTFDIHAIDDPHDLDDVDIAIVPGEFGVAENGAIWIDGASLRHRVLLFIAQHLAIIVPAESLLPHMHAAYERLSTQSDGQPFRNPGFGVFLSGPSKTADIEQSLVIGAHGARSLTVYLVEEM